MDVLSDTVVDTSVAGIMMGFVTGVGVEMLADANVDMSTSLTSALEFAVPKPLGEFNCCAAFGC